MKKGKFLLIIGFSAMSSVVLAQDVAFKILANKGATEVKSGDSWTAVKTGGALKASDELKVPANAYLGLVHVSSGKPLEVKEAGNYKVSDLASKVNVQGTSVLNKYTDFILSSNSAEAKKNRLSATGAVHRGLNPEMAVFLPSQATSSIYGKDLVVNWESKIPGPYIVTIMNVFEDELAKVETSENSVTFDVSDAKFASESAIMVSVKPKVGMKAKLDNIAVKRLSNPDREKIKQAMADEGISELKDDNALDYIYLASFYEKHGLIADAVAAYAKAIKLAPPDTFKEMYDNFLFRNKLKVETDTK